MAQFLGTPKVQFFDDNGDPLSGGKLYTYDPGTTDNKASYPTQADAAAGTNANANPVILDSRGEANVVLLGTTKLVLHDADDTEVWTVDNVDPQHEIIYDDNGNEIVKFEGVASAVNYLTVKSSATGNDVELEATGDDTNIGITLTPKGSGTVDIGAITLTTPFSVAATAASAAEIRLPEDTDNGSNYVSLKAPAALAADKTFVLPDDYGSGSEFLTDDGAGNLFWDSLSSTIGSFSAGVSVGTTQTISANTATKVTILTEANDPLGDFDDSIDRYTPSIAGKYLVMGNVSMNGRTDNTEIRVAIWKNGEGQVESATTLSATGNSFLHVSGFVFGYITFNGTTDYVELYVSQNSGGNATLDIASFMAFKVVD